MYWIITVWLIYLLIIDICIMSSYTSAGRKAQSTFRINVLSWFDGNKWSCYDCCDNYAKQVVVGSSMWYKYWCWSITTKSTYLVKRCDSSMTNVKWPLFTQSGRSLAPKNSWNQMSKLISRTYYLKFREIDSCHFKSFLGMDFF